jgi:hypothetical protein
MQAVSGIRTGRERAWLVTLAALSAMLLVSPGGLAAQVTNASAVLLAGMALLATYSTRSRPLIPRHPGHPFHAIPATDSTGSRSAIPRDPGHLAVLL